MPEKLLVVGAGVIGLELGSVWRRLGAQVTVVEFLDRILPGMDGEVAKQFQRLLEKQGVAFKLGAKVTAVDNSGKTLKARIEPAAGGAAETLEADIVLVAIGRVAEYREGLGPKEAGVAQDERGRVKTDGHLQTNVKGIYAIGDVIVGPMLAHKAEDEGVAVAEMIAGQAGHVNYDVIPGVVYTTPEAASVGKRPRKNSSRPESPIPRGKFPFTANGRSKVNQTTDGFVKVLADAKTDRVLGVHIIGREAGEMIHEAAVLEFRRLGGRPRAHLPRPSDAFGGREGSGACGRQARYRYVIGFIEHDAEKCEAVFGKHHAQNEIFRVGWYSSNYPTRLSHCCRWRPGAFRVRIITMQYLTRPLEYIFKFLLAVIFLIEAWLWEHLEPLVARFVAIFPMERLKTWIALRVADLSPAMTLIVFLVPAIPPFPLKLMGLWLLAHDYWIAAFATLVIAKLIGVGVTAFVFDVTRPKLLEMRWFRWVYREVLRARDWADALVDPVRRRIRERVGVWRARLSQRWPTVFERRRRPRHSPAE